MKKLLIMFFVLFSISVFAKDIGNVVVIANKSSKLSNLTLIELKRVFLKQMKTVKGVKVKPVISKKGEFLDYFNKNVLKMTEKEVKDYWIKQRIKGLSTPPKKKSTSKSVLRYVSRKKKYISYLLKKDLKGELVSKVKIIKINKFKTLNDALKNKK